MITNTRKVLPTTEIIQDYLLGFNMNQIADKYNCSGKGVQKLLTRNKIEKRTRSQARRQFQFDENYFEYVDSNEKAYWLGFIAADGCITKRGNSKCLSINLQAADRCILEQFKLDLGYEGNIYDLPIRKRNPKPQVMIRLNSELFCNHLEKYSITERKSFTIQFPNIEEQYKSHYIRGFFDGDGCISVGKYCKRVTFYSGSLDFLKSIESAMSNSLDIKPRIPRIDRKIFSLCYASNTEVADIFQWLYKDASFYLERKYNKFN